MLGNLPADNSVQEAESLVLGSRETLRSVEQDVLFNGATAYMDVLRDTANLNLQRNNVEVLEEQLRQTRDRFNVGEVTRTDVAQAEARLALARSQVSVAESNLRGSIARFRQVVGVEPRQLAPGRPVDRLVPMTVENAIFAGLHEHPSIHSALHALDAAEAQVKITEGELYPAVGVRGSAQQRWDTTVPGDERFVGSAVATLTVPIYEGGEVYARVRQAKETAGQRRIEADIARDLVRANVVTAWGQCGRWGVSRRSSLPSTSRNTRRRSISTRSRTSGTACAPRTGAELRAIFLLAGGRGSAALVSRVLGEILHLMIRGPFRPGRLSAHECSESEVARAVHGGDSRLHSPHHRGRPGGAEARSRAEIRPAGGFRDAPAAGACAARGRGRARAWRGRAAGAARDQADPAL